MLLTRKSKIIIAVVAVCISLAIIIPAILYQLKEDKRSQEDVRQARIDKFHMYASTSHTALEEARAFLKENGIPTPLFADLTQKAGFTPPKICIGIQTAARKVSPINYLEQTVGSLLARMKLPDDDIYIHVFNVQDPSIYHKDIESVQDLVPVTSTKGQLPAEINVPMIPQYAEAHDHLEAMRVLMKIGCKYPILIEDDALPQIGWVDQIRKAIDQLEKRGTDWFVVKLYIARKPQDERKNKSYVGITDFDQGFNGVALMYNPLHMLRYGDSLVQHTREVMAGRLGKEHYEFKDTYMHYFKKMGYAIEAFEPPIFQHTGIYSSVNNRPLDKFPWYMESREFVSENVPIKFDANLWQGLLQKKQA